MKLSKLIPGFSLALAIAAPLSIWANAAEHPPVEVLETRDEVRFVVVGDTQFANHAVWERMAHEIEMLRPGFVIQIGDLIQGYTHDHDQARNEWVEYGHQIEPITAPFYPVPGNHDVVTPETREVYAEEWGDNRFWYSFEYGPAKIIVVDTWVTGEQDRIGEWQREWVRETLEEWAERVGDDIDDHGVFVFTHSPLWRYADDHQGRQQWNQLHDILKEYPTRLVVGGHTHEYVWEDRDGIEYIVLNSSAASRALGPDRAGNIHAFLHVSMVDGDVRYAVVNAGSILPLDTVNTDERATVPRYHIPARSIRIDEWAEGEPMDLTIKVPVGNPLEEERRFQLQWSIPFDSNVHISPQTQWVTVPAGGTVDAEFHIEADATPAIRNRPWLEITSQQRLRSGVVDREWEATYRDRASRAAAGEDVRTTRIRLDDTYTFRARWDLFAPPVHRAVRRDGDITIDGRIDEAAWEAAPVLTDLKTSNGRVVEHRTEVRFLYDDDYLYVAAWMEEPNPEALVAEAGGDIPFTWNDDDFELFVDTLETQEDYHRLFINSVGTRFNSKPRWLPDSQRYFESAYESAIHIGDDHWAVEMRIPWSDLDVEDVGPGTRWGLNVGRHRQQDSTPRQHWSIQDGGGIYNPRHYGVLLFE